MITSTIAGSIIGFLGSAAEPVIGYFQQKEANKLEIDRMQHAVLMAKAGFSHDKIMYSMAAQDKEHERLLDHDIEITKSATGWIGSLQRSVRPIITYSFFLLFATVEVSVLYHGLSSDLSFNEAMQFVWDDDTKTIFAAIISFWFGNRQFEKSKQKKASK